MSGHSLPLQGGGDISGARRSGHPLLAKGFRPFFLLAGLHGAVFVPLWVLALRGQGLAVSAIWHGSEMVFGFTSAVLAGFLLTAVGNWTSRETASGGHLAILALLWVGGRIAGLSQSGFALPLQLMFLPALVLTLARPLIGSKNRRNYAFLVLLSALFAAQLVIALSPSYAPLALKFAVDLVLVIIVTISARIFPMFTRNGLRGAGADAQSAKVKSHPGADRVATGAMVAVAVLGLVPQLAKVQAIAAGLAAIAIIVRSRDWQGHHTRSVPLLWVLHAGNTWLVVGLGLRAATLLGVPPTVGLHALTVGVIATLCLGMMARVGMGHTGRNLVAPRGANLAFVLLTLSALVRVAAPLVKQNSLGWLIAGGLYSTAFAIFVVVFTPVLWAPRVDGKPG